MAETTVTVGSKVGLHARPAALLVKVASAQSVPVKIRKADGNPVDARSILQVLGLGAKGGEEVVISAEGDDADAALAAVAEVIAKDHDADA